MLIYGLYSIHVRAVRIILFLLSVMPFAAASECLAADEAALVRLVASLMGDSIDAQDDILHRLDSMSERTGADADIAVATTFIARGEKRVGRRLLAAAVERTDDVSAPVFEAIEYMIATACDSDEYLSAVELKVNFLARIDSVCPEAYSELGALYAASGRYEKALSMADKVAAAGMPTDTILAGRMITIYRQALQHREKHERNLILMLAAIFVFCLAACVCVLLFVWRKHRHAAQKVEPHIVTYQDAPLHMFELAVSEMERTREFVLSAEHKLASGQAKDLYSSVAKGKYAAQSREYFLETFDDAFLKSFPDFGTRLNELLKEDCQLVVQLPLTPEVRIAALMSLGLDGGSRLSQILGLSLNTVYTYRNRLKGRALQRDTFEMRLREITH